MIEMDGMVFGKLTVLCRSGSVSNGAGKHTPAYRCGKEVVCGGYTLRSGIVKSCGCLSIEKLKKRATTHGMKGTAVYNAWRNMRARCSALAAKKDRAAYYEKGIRVCKEWESFAVFYEWAKGKWENGLTIDRINTKDGYRPENCRFVTPQENAMNRTTSKFWKINGKSYPSLSSAAKALKTTTATIHQKCCGRSRDGRFYAKNEKCFSEAKYD